MGRQHEDVSHNLEQRNFVQFIDYQEVPLVTDRVRRSQITDAG